MNATRAAVIVLLLAIMASVRSFEVAAFCAFVAIAVYAESKVWR